MSQVPNKLRYTETHEWVKEEDGTFTIGITDHAQTMLGDLVYVELPEVEATVEKGQECAVVESVKAAGDIYAPLAGEVIEINMAVIENPQLINQDPYGKGWLIRIKPHDKESIQWLSAEDYTKLVASEAH